MQTRRTKRNHFGSNNLLVQYKIIRGITHSHKKAVSALSYSREISESVVEQHLIALEEKKGVVAL
ncbi:MAG: hypothetical protein H3C35_08440 [Bacteroidetes bacterium]|nr:hypothetical protein [Bacteroidota bacterium]